jgi:hypothetical protein
MKSIVILVFIFSFQVSHAQNIIKEQFESESWLFNDGHIFNINENLFVVLEYNGTGLTSAFNRDSIYGYKHQFSIKQYDFEKNIFNTLFNSKNDKYESALTDVIVFQNHFIVKTIQTPFPLAESRKQKKINSKILVIDLKGKIISEKTFANDGLLSNLNSEKYFLFLDENKNEHLLNLQLTEQENKEKISYLKESSLKNHQLLNLSYSYKKNEIIDDADSLLSKNNIGGCYSDCVIKIDVNSETSYILGCQFDDNFENDVINLFKKQGTNINKVSTYSLGRQGHHWVHDAILFQGKIFAIFSSGDNDIKKKLGFGDIDQFMWFVEIGID